MVVIEEAHQYVGCGDKGGEHTSLLMDITDQAITDTFLLEVNLNLLDLPQLSQNTMKVIRVFDRIFATKCKKIIDR